MQRARISSSIAGPVSSKSATGAEIRGSWLSRGAFSVPSNDVEYYRQRATAERKMALAADRQEIAEIHLELARLYDALVNQPALRPKLHISTQQRKSG